MMPIHYNQLHQVWSDSDNLQPWWHVVLWYIPLLSNTQEPQNVCSTSRYNNLDCNLTLLPTTITTVASWCSFNCGGSLVVFCCMTTVQQFPTAMVPTCLKYNISTKKHLTSISSCFFVFRQTHHQDVRSLHFSVAYWSVSIVLSVPYWAVHQTTSSTRFSRFIPQSLYGALLAVDRQKC